MKTGMRLSIVLALGVCVAACCFGCAAPKASPATTVVRVSVVSDSADAGSFSGASADSSASSEMSKSSESCASSSAAADSGSSSSSASSASAADKLFAALDIDKDFREGFVHGSKPAKYQKYIVLHDTEGEGSPESVVEYWGEADEGIAAHFVVGKDGHIVQCVPLNKIAHHAGFGDTGHNEEFGVEDESRDDKVGTEPIGDWASDYGMNSYSIGIELVHVGGEGDYPKKQLKALDNLIAYLDAYYDKECEVIDHKMWRTGNSDTSEEFAEYLENYQDHRSYK